MIKLKLIQIQRSAWEIAWNLTKYAINLKIKGINMQNCLLQRLTCNQFSTTICKIFNVIIFFKRKSALI